MIERRSEAMKRIALSDVDHQLLQSSILSNLFSDFPKLLRKVLRRSKKKKNLGTPNPMITEQVIEELGLFSPRAR